MARVLVGTKDLTKEEWLSFRKKGLGGSDAGAILGVNKYKTPFQVYLDKTEDIIDDTAGEAAYWGNTLEEIVAREFTVRTGKKVRRTNKMYQSEAYPYMIANLDRLIVGEDAFLECKTANAFLGKEWNGEEIPASYLAQVMHYMIVTGYKKCYIAVLIGGQRFLWKELDYDEELGNMIIKSEAEFWHHHVEAGIAPPLDGTSAAEEYLKEKFARAKEETTVELKSSYADQIERMLELKKYADDYSEMAKEIENNIKLEIGDNENAFAPGYHLTWKNVASNRVDSKMLKANYPDIYKAVCKESLSRRFAIKNIKEVVK